MAMVGRLAPGEELRTGFTMQMVDEFRHSTIQMNLKKWYMENYIDPAGFDITEAAFGKCYATTIGRQFAEGFLTGDAVTAANVFLTSGCRNRVHQHAVRRDAVGSRAQRRLCVADGVPVGAVRRKPAYRQRPFAADVGDQRSGQPSFAGARSALRLLAKPRHRRCRDRYLHRIRHHQPRQEQGILRELWHRWIYEDYYRTYMLPLEKYGIKIHHDDVAAAWDRIVKKNYVHKVAQFFSVGWPVNFWRIEAQTEKDFEWFEHKYPGWYAEFGDYWKWYAKKSIPGETNMLFNRRTATCTRTAAGAAGAVPDPRRLRLSTSRRQLYTYCSEGCRWTHKVAFAAEYEGPADAGDGPLQRSPRMGRVLPRLGSRRLHQGSRFSCAATARPWCRSRICASTTRTCGRSTTFAVIRSRARSFCFRGMTPEQREKHIAEYRKGFKINPVN
jgi:propane monooxygenase large subunit